MYIDFLRAHRAHEKVALLAFPKARVRRAQTHTMFKFGTGEQNASLILSSLTLARHQLCVINRAAADWLKMQMARVSEESRAWESAAGEDEDAGARAKTSSL
jgi:hypothetical protein